MKAVQEHLGSCPDCALFAEEMKKTLSILNLEKNPEVTPFFYTRVKAKLENQQEAESFATRRPMLVRVLQPVAFSLLLVLGIYVGIRLGNTTSPKPGHMIAKQEIIPYWNELDAEPIESFLLNQP